MKKLISLMLALALCLALTACGGGEAPADTSTASGAPESTAPAQPSQSGTAEDPAPSPEESAQPETPAPSQPGDPVLTLNRTDFTLKSAGASWRLRYTCEPDIDAIAEFSSDDESVATVAEDGTVTAVAPGQATITLKYGDLTAQCIVRCRWTEESGGASSPSQPPASSRVDLTAFAQSVLSSYEFGFLELIDPADETGAALLTNYYSGLDGLELNQMVVYICMMSMNNGEFALVEAKDAAGAAAAAAAFQARIDMMVDGGAWYPEPTRRWSECSTVVTNGNYVMMVVSEQYSDIVKEFNALF